MSLLGGQRAWLLQRVTAVYAGVYLLGAVALLLVRPPADHGAWLALVAHPAVWLATALFVLVLLLHAWVGLRDVILDYLKPAWVRLTVLTLAAGVFLVMGFWALWILIDAVLR
ncbi:Succinate dehydrogenase hydrophobic membrane anchor protein [Thioalkalivibrio nitratireducens DSM 14787]|uniref:Succinate dehydrogenase hydrophobic membrane anchor subunit n=1 Tax=Thioalkalivibrio nitratireducens (strain DSM 14787 / UNIQEM 213 / ALEN2) TaxID=1255043 RepID=L0DU42_THIND|nr:succinate dehydrogenase, hydrophobic membrane anchor protein [Thioalkalivibrio nitratireducens]AGA33114.1 Succinate dehydrogenase hydrophobic membrane anchor protein [Thioalkalivibrio nitratireducens DSM 14787]